MPPERVDTTEMVAGSAGTPAVNAESRAEGGAPTAEVEKLVDSAEAARVLMESFPGVDTLLVERPRNLETITEIQNLISENEIRPDGVTASGVSVWRAYLTAAPDQNVAAARDTLDAILSDMDRRIGEITEDWQTTTGILNLKKELGDTLKQVKQERATLAAIREKLIKKEPDAQEVPEAQEEKPIPLADRVANFESEIEASSGRYPHERLKSWIIAQGYDINEVNEYSIETFLATVQEGNENAALEEFETNLLFIPVYLGTVPVILDILARLQIELTEPLKEKVKDWKQLHGLAEKSTVEISVVNQSTESTQTSNSELPVPSEPQEEKPIPLAVLVASLESEIEAYEGKSRENKIDAWVSDHGFDPNGVNAFFIGSLIDRARAGDIVQLAELFEDQLDYLGLRSSVLVALGILTRLHIELPEPLRKKIVAWAKDKGVGLPNQGEVTISDSATGQTEQPLPIAPPAGELQSASAISTKATDVVPGSAVTSEVAAPTLGTEMSFDQLFDRMVEEGGKALTASEQAFIYTTAQMRELEGGETPEMKKIRQQLYLAPMDDISMVEWEFARAATSISRYLEARDAGPVREQAYWDEQQEQAGRFNLYSGDYIAINAINSLKNAPDFRQRLLKLATKFNSSE